ncbi:sensor histidine kinase [Litorimonas sp. RW-G-Af-16]|uniref:sensor histidine kinase n=1 Tax=Litorimonas sp. RW-G-Af-16 TaxID=3241168 RepID=UPI00390C5530
MSSDSSPLRSAPKTTVRGETNLLENQDILIICSLSLLSIFIMGIITNAPLSATGAVLALFGAAMLLYWSLRKRQSEALRKLTLEHDNTDVLKMAEELIDNLPFAIAITDRDHTVIHANALAQELVNIGAVGKPLSNSVNHSELEGRLSRALAGYEPEPLMLHIEDPREQYIRLLFSKAQSFGRQARNSMTFVFFDDVTEINLEQTRRADFLANASHELKTPIASLMGYIETLRGHAKDDPVAQEKFLGIMKTQAERMQRLIDDLLSLRRIEQTENIAPSEISDLHLAIMTAIEAVKPLADKREIVVAYRASGEKKALVRGKQDECVQLFLNLIENAVKISPSGSHVSVRIRRLEQWSPVRAFEDGRLADDAHSRRIVNAPPSPLPAWLVTISDDGPGFAKEHISRLGERFYRVAGDLSSKEKGTGLGLAICKHIVKRHRGGLYIRSTRGKGTDFSILLMAETSSD